MSTSTRLSAIQTDMNLTSAGELRYNAFVSGAWNIGGNPNGGYLLSIILSAMQRESEHPDPLSVTTHYLRPGSPDEAGEVVVERVRSGRTVTTLRGTLVQAGRDRITVLAAFGDLDEPAGVDQVLRPERPQIPQPEECIPRTGDLQDIKLPIVDRIDVRLHPDQLEPGGSSQAAISGWIRFVDGTDATSLNLPLFADCFPPSVVPKLGRVGWVPTLELTVHVRARPAPGWIQAEFQTSDLAGGRMIESGLLWDSEGQLVAQSRQLGLVMNGSS